MIDVLPRLGKRLAWWALARAHRAGFSRGLNDLVNRFEKNDGYPVVRRRKNGNVQILAYHRVTRRPDPFLPSTPLHVFERQMETLARRFQVIDLDAAVTALERGKVPRNAVVVTFDDGYRDNLDLAYPVLARLALPATVFLTSGYIGTDRLLWHDRVFRMFGETQVPALNGFLPDGGSLPLHDPVRRRASRARVLEHLKSLEPGYRDACVDRLGRALAVAEPSPRPRLMLNWDEVKQLHRGGISLGAHTVSHAVLSRVSADRAREEIIESKRQIESQLGTSVTSFAYPNGQPSDFHAETKRVLQEAGYRCAVTTIFGSNSLSRGTFDRFELRRGGPDDADPALFEAKMNVYKFLT